jgi:glycerophosphoryl diester phosphodiesterase
MILMRYPMITGHTGNDGTPANSIDSVKKSISLEADAFEVDVRRDENSVLVLTHDQRSQNGYDACVRLSEIFEIMTKHPDIRINCDLKDNDMPLEVAALADKSGITKCRLILTGTVTPDYLERHPEIIEMADIYMNAECIMENICLKKASESGLDISAEIFRDNPWKHIKDIIHSIDPYIEFLSSTCKKYGLKGINLPYKCLSDKNIQDFKKCNISLSVWTVDDETEMSRLFSLGVENLTTRRVSPAKTIRKNLLGF